MQKWRKWFLFDSFDHIVIGCFCFVFVFYSKGDTPKQWNRTPHTPSFQKASRPKKFKTPNGRSLFTLTPNRLSTNANGTKLPTPINGHSSRTVVTKATASVSLWPSFELPHFVSSAEQEIDGTQLQLSIHESSMPTENQSIQIENPTAASVSPWPSIEPLRAILSTVQDFSLDDEFLSSAKRNAKKRPQATDDELLPAKRKKKTKETKRKSSIVETDLGCICCLCVYGNKNKSLSINACVGQRVCERNLQFIQTDRVPILCKACDLTVNKRPKKCDCCLCVYSHANKSLAIDFCIREPTIQRRSCARKLQSTQNFRRTVLCNSCRLSLNNQIVTKCSKNVFECYHDECTLEFSTRLRAVNHALEHIQLKNYMCEVCPLHFKNLQSLKSHERIHLR